VAWELIGGWVQGAGVEDIPTARSQGQGNSNIGRRWTVGHSDRVIIIGGGGPGGSSGCETGGGHQVRWIRGIRWAGGLSSMSKRMVGAWAWKSWLTGAGSSWVAVPTVSCIPALQRNPLLPWGYTLVLV